MKNFYSYLTLLLCVLYSTTIGAQTTTEHIDLTFCLQIEDPSLCYVQDSNYKRVELVKGENVLTTKLHKTTYSDGSGYAYSDTYYLYIESDKQNDYRITACDVEVGGTRSPYSNFYSSTTNMSINFNSEDMDGCTLYPTISNLNDLRTATATVTVDDASKVQVRCGNNGYMPTLENGRNTISFDPVNEASWAIGAKNYGDYLGGVKLNGNSVSENYGTFYLTVAEGDNVEITAASNAEPVKVSFTGNLEAVKNVYKYVNYSKEEFDGDWKEGLELDPRTQIIVSLDRNAYNVTSVTVNGQSQSIYSDDLYITITDETVINVTAEKYSTFSLPLEITDPAHITVKVAESQYGNSAELTDLVAGLQTLEISSKNAYMIVNKKDGFAIDKVSYVVKGEETEVEEYYGTYYIPLAGAEKVIVVSHEIERNDVATLWINDMDKCYTFYMQRSDNSYCFHSSYEPNPVPVTGEQTFKFDAEIDNPISLYFSPKDYDNPGYVTVNDEVAYPMYQGSTNYALTLKDGDVVKVWMGETVPVTNDYTITLNVDVADRVIYLDENWEETVLPAGNTELTFNGAAQISLYAVDGFGIGSVVNTTTGESFEEGWGGFDISLTPANANHVFAVTTYDEDEARTGEMPIWVDNASKVVIYYASNYQQAAPLVDGDNVFRYNPLTETAIRISEVNYGELYQVKVNGEVLTADYGQYYVECSPENKVEIYANFPDVDVPVTISLANEGTEGAIQSVEVNGAAVTNWADGFSVKMGDQLGIVFNNTDFNVTAATLNGEYMEDFYWGWNEVVKEEKLDFVVTAEKWNTISFNITVNDPAAVTVYKGGRWNEAKFTDLVAGENTVEMAESVDYITVMPNSGATINSITLNGEAVYPQWGEYTINIVEGDEVVIDAQSAQRDKKAIVIVDDAEKASYLCKMWRSDESEYDDNEGHLATGENIVMFDDKVDNPFIMSFYGPELEEGQVKIYINESTESLVPDYNNYFSGIVLADGDVVYVCINGGDTPTAINTVNTTTTNNVYNMQGMKVQNTNNLPAGIYIINGKKVVKK